MKREPTISLNPAGLSLSKVIPQQLGDTLSFSVNKESHQIIISREPGEHMALVTYPTTIPIVKSVPLIKWIQSELGKRNYSRMPAVYEDGRFIIQTGENNG